MTTELTSTSLPPLVVLRGIELGAHQHGRDDCDPQNLVRHDLAGAHAAPEPEPDSLRIEDVGIEHTVLDLT